VKQEEEERIAREKEAAHLAVEARDDSHIVVPVDSANALSAQAADESVRQVATTNSMASIAQIKVSASQKVKETRNRSIPGASLKKLVQLRREKRDLDFLELESNKRDVIVSLKPLPPMRPGLEHRGFGGLDKLFFFDPIMTVPYSERKSFRGMLDHVRNNISKLSTPGHLRMDANLPSVSEEYIFAGKKAIMYLCIYVFMYLCVYMYLCIYVLHIQQRNQS
jgi:hypothetical protein